ncbi:hypothetical protein AGR13a_Cc310032 [Agrobacterium genomosp. 13 str. CFBP 6927]|uniref:Uncharacterized protein n=1 Tax=Agrobacterium genomosp. 13 str. CFBP 6927 TaxID=1183428 RepID=A0ABM9VH92_9HYPH|nr:hypothetical protein AGR13a_Cc310032 [Agrobacterium genomosp. 13 str. CFBP 6927]
MEPLSAQDVRSLSVIPQWHSTVFSRFKPIATILSVFIFVQRTLFFEYAPISPRRITAQR